MSVTIRFFGQGVRNWICYLPIDQFNAFDKIRLKHQVEWGVLLFDLDFLAHYGYAHWSELSDQEEQKGALIYPSDRIEIKLGKRTLLKTSLVDILNETQLFELYNTTKRSLEILPKSGFQALILQQAETGLIASYRIATQHFEIEALTFQLTQIPALSTEIYLDGLRYDGKSLELQKEDTVVTGLRVFVV